jgi:hypothetical protein
MPDEVQPETERIAPSPYQRASIQHSRKSRFGTSTAESRAWKVLNLIAILLTAIVPACVALYTSPHSNEKRLEADKPFATNFFAGLNDIKGLYSMSFQVDGKPVKNIEIVSMAVHNAGLNPIVPSDFYEKLSINSNKPWIILFVVSNDPPVNSVWHKVNDQKFEADPLLLNPGDSVHVNVYVTNSEVDQPSMSELQNIGLRWSAHILNLKDINIKPNVFSELPHEMWGAIIMLYGWGLVLTLILSMLFLAEYVYLLFGTVIASGPLWKVILSILGSGFLSLAASESISTYVFPNVFLRVSGISTSMNVPWIVANFVLLLYLWWKSAVARTRGASI